jgi:hypothetical protein
MPIKAKLEAVVSMIQEGDFTPIMGNAITADMLNSIRCICLCDTISDFGFFMALTAPRI